MESRLIEYLLKKRPRDQSIVKNLKKLYQETCQICGTPLILFGHNSRGLAYSEVCHIHPLGLNGLDDYPNMLVLCPNHHKLFDLGVITFDPDDKELKTIIHVDKNHPLHNRKLALSKHELSPESIRYHHDTIFLPVHDTVNRQ